MFVTYRVAAAEQPLLVEHLEAHVDGVGLLVLVLHLRLGQRRAAIGAPVNRLVAFDHMAVGHDPPERTDDVGLEPVVHGQVRIVPVPQHAQAHEVRALAVHLLAGIVAARLAEIGGADLSAGLAHLLLHLQFDGQPVAVPARHIGRIEAVKSAALDDNVLEHLVDRMADVNLAVGVGRTVVQDENRAACGPGADGLVEALVLPAFEHFRFALGKVAPHRESGLRKVKGALVIAHGVTSSTD